MMMKRTQGFTLLEVLLAMTLSSAILGAIVVLYQPILKHVAESMQYHQLRQKLSNPLDAIGKEISAARAVYVDSSRCYKLCLQDRATGNRVMYYVSGTTLYRKSEAAGSSVVTCSGGKPFLTEVDLAKTAFTMNKNVVKMTLATTDSFNHSFQLHSAFFPTFMERYNLFYDTFACETATSQGWVFTNPAKLSWSVQSSASSSSRYWLYETLTQNQGSPLTASAEIPLDLSRLSSAYLKFSYRTVGTMDPGEELGVFFYNGTTWTEIYRDNLLGNLKSLQYITIDLSSFSLNANNKLRFDGSLTKTADHWIIDEIEILPK